MISVSCITFFFTEIHTFGECDGEFLQAGELQELDPVFQFLSEFDLRSVTCHQSSTASCSIADSGDPVVELFRQQSYAAGTCRVHEASESACKEDASDVFDLLSQLLCHKLYSCTDSAFGHLNLADIFLSKVYAVTQWNKTLTVYLFGSADASAFIQKSGFQADSDSVDKTGTADTFSFSSSDDSADEGAVRRPDMIYGSVCAAHSEKDVGSFQSRTCCC